MIKKMVLYSGIIMVILSAINLKWPFLQTSTTGSLVIGFALIVIGLAKDTKKS